jgi:hypothetical protein
LLAWLGDDPRSGLGELDGCEGLEVEEGVA